MMQSAEYLVSICIPTYNRAPYLKKCIESLICQPEFLSGRVEIVVSDNASTDDTENLIKQYILRFPNIAYYRNEVNVSNQNFPMVLMRANGILRKLNNDTALFKNNSLRFFCEIAEKYKQEKPVLFWQNQKIGRNTGLVKSANNLSDFLQMASYLITWIGGFSVWAEDCQYLSVNEEKCAMHLWQVWAICHLLEMKEKALLIQEKFVEVQNIEKKDVTYGLFQVFFLNYFAILNEFKQKNLISENTWEYLKKDILYGFFLEYIIRWELGGDTLRYSNKEDLKTLVFNAYKDAPYLLDFQRLYRKRLIKKRLKMKKENIRNLFLSWIKRDKGH